MRLGRSRCRGDSLGSDGGQDQHVRGVDGRLSGDRLAAVSVALGGSVGRVSCPGFDSIIAGTSRLGLQLCNEASQPHVRPGGSEDGCCRAGKFVDILHGPLWLVAPRLLVVVVSVQGGQPLPQLASGWCSQ